MVINAKECGSNKLLFLEMSVKSTNVIHSYLKLLTKSSNWLMHIRQVQLPKFKTRGRPDLDICSKDSKGKECFPVSDITGLFGASESYLIFLFRSKATLCHTFWNIRSVNKEPVPIRIHRQLYFGNSIKSSDNKIPECWRRFQQRANLIEKKKKNSSSML